MSERIVVYTPTGLLHRDDCTWISAWVDASKPEWDAIVPEATEQDRSVKTAYRSCCPLD